MRTDTHHIQPPAPQFVRFSVCTNCDKPIHTVPSIGRRARWWHNDSNDMRCDAPMGGFATTRWRLSGGHARRTGTRAHTRQRRSFRAWRAVPILRTSPCPK